MKPLRLISHSEERMRERNITEAEVREALGQPPEQHWHPIHERMNVRHRFPGLGMTLVVAYEERVEYIVVVTVIEE